MSPRLIAIAVACAAGTWVPVTAHAFSNPLSYSESPSTGGGGGRWFTGSPAEGYDCTVCHEGRDPFPVYLEGLPDVYVPGATYDVRLVWPEYAAYAAAYAQDPNFDFSMGLVAEFIAETTHGAGSIEVASGAGAQPGERCTFPADQQATQLFNARYGRRTRLVPVEQPEGVPETEYKARCDATMREDRCLIAVSDCGAQEVRFRWTAPPLSRGPIWFTAGFVATDHASGHPNADGTTEIVKPMVPVASASSTYRDDIEASTCSVAAPLGARAPRAGAWLGLLALGLLFRRAWRRAVEEHG